MSQNWMAGFRQTRKGSSFESLTITYFFPAWRSRILRHRAIADLSTANQRHRLPRVGRHSLARVYQYLIKAIRPCFLCGRKPAPKRKFRLGAQGASSRTCKSSRTKQVRLFLQLFQKQAFDPELSRRFEFPLNLRCWTL